jgi:Tol biopolymer transport system component
MPLTPGALLGPYAITRPIGAGGMGEVYLARDTRLGRQVAIKVLGAGLDLIGERRGRFLREAQAISAITHPNIVTLYDISEHDGRDFLVMEYVEGRTLDVVRGPGRLPAAQAITYGRQIADAMARAHAAGVLHRDLKPSNVIVADDGTVKVLDFGLARIAGPAPSDDAETVSMSPALTQQGSVSGTPAYMSPEQAEGGPVDARSDIFSFGALLYELVSGSRAFQGRSAAGTIAAVLHEDPKPFGALGVDVPPALQALIDRCLRKDPAKRVQTMADVSATLADLEDGVANAPSAVPERGTGWRWWSAAALIVAAVAVWIALWAGEGTGPARLVAVPLTSHVRNERAPTLSPDGSQVAYVADHAGNFDIYVQVADAGVPPVRLTNTPELESTPTWSPDGRWIVFNRAFPDKRAQTIRRAPVGGTEAVISDQFCQFPSWAPDSRAIVCGTPGPGPRGLRRFPIDGGPAMVLTAPPAGVMDMFPAVSPDGRTIAFLRLTGSSEARDLYELTVDAEGRAVGEPVLRQKFGSFAGYLTYLSRNELLLTVRTETGTVGGELRIARLSLAGQPSEPTILDLPEGTLYRPVVANGRLVYEHITTRDEIWRTQNGVEEQHPVTSTRSDNGARFSPDGTRIAFISTRSGQPEVWVAKADGADATQITSIGGIDHVNWAPDGNWLVFDHREATTMFAIYAVPASGGAPRRLTDGTATDRNPSVSRDGRRVYFSSDRTGRREVYRMTADGRDLVAISSGGGDYPLETFDGQSVVYVRQAGSARGLGPLFIVPVTGGESTRLPISSQGAYVIGRAGVYVRTRTERSVTIYDPVAGTTQVLSAVPASNMLSSVSPDGAVLLWTARSLGTADLMVVNNFR